MAKNENIIVTPPGTASYVHLGEPYQESGKFQMNIIFPPGADTSEIESAIDRVAKEKWPKGLPKKFAHPLRECDEKEGQAGYEAGGVFIVPKSVNRPKLFDRQKNRIEAGEFYAGSKVRASVTVYAYDAKGNVGVTFGLVNVQKLGDGTPLVGVATDGDELDAMEDDELSDVLGE